MLQERFNLLSIIISGASLVITGIGIYAVYFQIRKLRSSTWSNTNSKLCDQSFELIRFFSESPNTYDYFYNKKILENDDPNRISILYATEALANFMEHLMLQKENLPDRQWEVWQRFILSTFQSSFIIRDFLQEHREWYSPDLLSIADKYPISGD